MEVGGVDPVAATEFVVAAARVVVAATALEPVVAAPP